MRKEIFSLKKHIASRDVNFEKTRVFIDEERGIASFLLYNLSGKLVGYQTYNPGGEKETGGIRRVKLRREGKSLVDTMKYFTYSSKIGKVPEIVVWGLETYNLKKPLYIVEGIFDAIKLHNLNLSAIAILSNNPKHLKSWLNTLPNFKVVVSDNDDAGNSLKKFGDISLTVPQGFDDLGEMTSDQIKKFLKNKRIKNE